jgi:hypothetical protein
MPNEWYMHARLDRRKVMICWSARPRDVYFSLTFYSPQIIFHAGPTNSGKTYTALERLKLQKKTVFGSSLSVSGRDL